MKRVVLGCGLLLLLSAFPLQAEDSLRGRLPDGRAFRTDANGIQLVDYTAELELTIEELNRQVRAMENELEDRPAGVGRGLQERDILKQQPPRPMLPGQRRQVSRNGFDCPVCPTAPATEDVQRLKAENSVLKTRLRSMSGEESSDQNALLERKDGIIAHQRERISALLEKVSDVEEQAQEFKAELTSTQTQQQKAIVPIAMREDARASFRPSNSRALTSMRSALKSDVNRLQGFMRTRSIKYKSFASRGRNSVSFQMSPAVSDRGLKVDQIKRLIKEAATLEDLADLKRDVKDIRAKVRDDIALIERMSR